MAVKSISRIFLIALIVWPPLFASAGVEPEPSNSEVDAIVRSYITAEESQDYGRMYLLLSRGMKEQLRRENAVKDAKDYRQLRYSSEARWFDFSETKRGMQAKEATVVFNVTIEESGERERVPVTVRLIFQEGHWRIDDIAY